MENLIISGFLLFDLVLFLIVHTILAQIVSQRSVFKILSWSIIIPSIISVIFAIFVYFRMEILLSDLLFYFLISLILFFMSSAVYIINLLGIVESSIRIRVLRLVVSKKDKGITVREIYKQYNSHVIIKKRIERFLRSGELVRRGSKLERGRKLSMTLIPVTIIHMFWILYSDDPWYESL